MAKRNQVTSGMRTNDGGVPLVDVKKVRIKKRKGPLADTAAKLAKTKVIAHVYRAHQEEQERRQMEEGTIERPDRSGKTMISAHFSNAVHHALRMVAAENYLQMQEAIGEALRDYLTKHGRNEAAALIPEPKKRPY